MKYISILLILVLFFTFVSCGKQNPKTDNTSTTNTGKREKADVSNKILEENKLKNLITIKNPNTMKIETSPRAKSSVDAEMKMGKDGAEKFLEYAAKNGMDMAIEEVSKSQAGEFARYFPNDNHFYLAFLEKIGDTWTVVGHATSRDYVGVEINIDQWVGLTGWLYWKAVSEKAVAGESNAIILDQVYWKDPAWADGKAARFTAYNRFYDVDNKLFWWHYCSWMDE